MRSKTCTSIHTIHGITLTKEKINKLYRKILFPAAYNDRHRNGTRALRGGEGSFSFFESKRRKELQQYVGRNCVKRLNERSERKGHFDQKLCGDLCQHRAAAAETAVVREERGGSEGEESEGRTNDWKWSGALVARVCERESVEARAGSLYPGHQ